MNAEKWDRGEKWLDSNQGLCRNKNGGYKSIGKSSYREEIKSINVPEMKSREVTISKTLICQNLVRETWKN